VGGFCAHRCADEEALRTRGSVGIEGVLYVWISEFSMTMASTRRSSRLIMSVAGVAVADEVLCGPLEPRRWSPALFLSTLISHSSLRGVVWRGSPLDITIVPPVIVELMARIEQIEPV